MRRRGRRRQPLSSGTFRMNIPKTFAETLKGTPSVNVMDSIDTNHESKIHSFLRFSRNLPSSKFVTGSLKSVNIWGRKTKKCLRTVRIECYSLSKWESRGLFLIGSKMKVVGMNIKKPYKMDKRINVKGEIIFHMMKIHSSKSGDDDDRFIIACKSGELKIISYDEGKVIQRICKMALSLNFTKMIHSRKYRNSFYINGLGKKNAIKLINYERKKTTKLLIEHSKPPLYKHSIEKVILMKTFLNNERNEVVIAASENGYIYIYDTSIRRMVRCGDSLSFYDGPKPRRPRTWEISSYLSGIYICVPSKTFFPTSLNVMFNKFLCIGSSKGDFVMVNVFPSKMEYRECESNKRSKVKERKGEKEEIDDEDKKFFFDDKLHISLKKCNGEKVSSSSLELMKTNSVSMSNNRRSCDAVLTCVSGKQILFIGVGDLPSAVDDDDKGLQDGSIQDEKERVVFLVEELVKKVGNYNIITFGILQMGDDNKEITVFKSFL